MKLRKHTLPLSSLALAFSLAHAAPAPAQKITISSDTAQILRFGIDAERLWFWRQNMADQLAAVAVTELKSAYVRVAINCAYEREEGVKKESAYTPILAMMTAMKKASPNIKFFATPRPLAEAYSKQESTALFGKDKAPWGPYPGWIMGLKEFGGGGYDVKKHARYYADYLNLMHQHGFDIAYMDITNEKQLATPAQMLYLRATLPKLLDAGMKMPLLIAPSSWNYDQGTNVLASLDTARKEDKAFEIASTHNTNDKGTPEAFAKAARRLNKEAWNTELHNWLGATQADEIKTSAILWRHIRAGFTGIDTWLFYGSKAKLTEHPMVATTGKPADGVIKSVRYEIYKKVVNAVNLGNYVPSTSTTTALVPTVMKKGAQTLICVLNTTGKQLDNITVELPSAQKIITPIEATLWDATTPKTGQATTLSATANTFQFTAPPNSLWCFLLTQSAN